MFKVAAKSVDKTFCLCRDSSYRLDLINAIFCLHSYVTCPVGGLVASHPLVPGACFLPSGSLAS